MALFSHIWEKGTDFLTLLLPIIILKLFELIIFLSENVRGMNLLWMILKQKKELKSLELH